MEVQIDLLDRVVAALEMRKGDLATVARETGLPYDTVLRIKNRENDPGFSKVAMLAAYLFQSEPAKAIAARQSDAPVPAEAKAAA